MHEKWIELIDNESVKLDNNKYVLFYNDFLRIFEKINMPEIKYKPVTSFSKRDISKMKNLIYENIL